MYFEKLASAIQNDVLSGLRGYHHNLSMSMEQLEDDIVDERLAIIKEYFIKGVLSKKYLMLAINCVPVDCKDLENCSKCAPSIGCTPTAHFEIPQLINEIDAIEYIGSTDKQIPFVVYSSPNSLRLQKYRRRGKDKPYVLIIPVPNENGMYDGYIFNAPLIRQISIIAAFKDPRQLAGYGCCSDYQDDNASVLSSEIKRRLTEKKLKYYRQYAAPIKPNNQEYAAG